MQAYEKPLWLKQVDWRDLVRYQPYEIYRELTLPLPWLVLTWWSAAQGWYGLTLLGSFYFFLTGLRVTHNAFHYALGLPRFVTDCVMLALSVLMLGAHHAIQVTHQRHHRYCLQEGDIEGNIARHSLKTALIYGLLHPWHIHRAGWQYGTAKQKRWIQIELAANLLWLALVVWSGILFLQIFSLLMLVAYALSGFFAVWTVHHDCPHDHWNQSRTLRSRWKNLICYQMFLHTEHHLFPQVPTCHLPELAKRLDVAGYAQHRMVF